MSEPVVSRGTIRFEDLGEPVQRLLKSLKSDVSDEDMALLEYVSVKDMARIYSEMTTDRHAEEIWRELREALYMRREKAARREAELAEKQRALEGQRQAMEEQARQQEAAEAEERRVAEEARQQRREERRLQREAEAAAAALETAEMEAAAALEAAEEAAEAAAEEEARRRRAEKKRRRREARERELQEEQDALRAEQARREERARHANQKGDWADYVQRHPLECNDETGEKADVTEIVQEKLKHRLNAPPQSSEAVLFRTYTPKCPNCGTKYTQPPFEWTCPLCMRQEGKHILVWQPDHDSKHCMVCKATIGRWSRHHCRNCGRLTCSSCCEARAVIPALGFKEPVKVCTDCAKSTSPRPPKRRVGDI